MSRISCYVCFILCRWMNLSKRISNNDVIVISAFGFVVYFSFDINVSSFIRSKEEETVQHLYNRFD